MTDGKAQAELLELVQLQDAKNFTLSVSCSDGHSVGEGDCFPAAWFGIDPGSVR